MAASTWMRAVAGSCAPLRQVSDIFGDSIAQSSRGLHWKKMGPDAIIVLVFSRIPGLVAARAGVRGLR